MLYVKNELHDIQDDIAIVPIGNANGNIDLHYKQFNATVIAKELGVKESLSTDTYNQINKLSANNIFDKKKISEN